MSKMIRARGNRKTIRDFDANIRHQVKKSIRLPPSILDSSSLRSLSAIGCSSAFSVLIFFWGGGYVAQKYLIFQV